MHDFSSEADKLQNSCLSRIALMAGTKLLLGHSFSIQGQLGTYLLIVTMSACIGCKAVLVVSLLVGLLAALTGEAFLSAPALIGDAVPNKDSSTWLFLPTVRYLSVAYSDLKIYGRKDAVGSRQSC